jgi:hypothetical protein
MTPDLAMAKGLDGANYTRAPGEGEMFLTAPFIDQTISLFEKSGSLSVKAMFQQP